MKGDDGMAFGVWLQQRMLERNLSQADLARATGRSPNIVSLWYRGIKQPSVRSVPRLAAALGVADADVLRVLTGVAPQAPPGDVVAALMQRLPEVPLSAAEVRLLCDLVEAFVWTIHRWGRHEAYLAGAAHHAVTGPRSAIESTCEASPSQERRAG
jgi:transcriptional regulator with XRE-family HTH domain